MFKKFALALATMGTVSLAQAQSSDEFIASSTQNILAKISVAKSEDYRPIIKKEVLPLFDWEQISKSTLGRNWRGMTPEQRIAFTQDFQALLIKTYGTYIEPYKKAQYSIVATKKLDDTDDSVKLKLKASGQPDIVLDYRILATQHLIEDVVIQDISFTQVFKTGFADEIAKNGMDSFLAKLHQKATS